MSNGGDVAKIATGAIIGGLIGGPTGAAAGASVGAVKAQKDNIADATKKTKQQLTQLKAKNPVTVMPTPDDAAVKKARERAIAGQIQRSGRESTILSDPSQRLGG